MLYHKQTLPGNETKELSAILKKSLSFSVLLEFLEYAQKSEESERRRKRKEGRVCLVVTDAFILFYTGSFYAFRVTVFFTIDLTEKSE